MKTKYIKTFAVILISAFCCISCGQLITDKTIPSNEDTEHESNQGSGSETQTNLGDESVINEAEPTSDSETQTNPGNESVINESEPTSNISQPISKMPDQNYIGTWTTDKKDIYLIIYEIAPTSIQFLVVIHNIVDDKGLTFVATATEKNGVISFGDGISTDYRGPSMLNGRLLFEDNSVSLIYDNLGEVPNYVKARENNCKFTIKENLTDMSIADYKAGHPEGTFSYIVKENFDFEILN